MTKPFILDRDVKSHWLAETYFLPLSSDDLVGTPLAQSIERQGSVDPILLYEHQLLDGRTRDDINIRLKRPRPAINFEDTPEGKAAAPQGKAAMDQAAIDYAIAKNVARRHYTTGQKAALASRLANMAQGARNDLMEPSEFVRKVSQPEAAKLYNVSVREIQYASRIYREGTTEDIVELEGGKLPPAAIVTEIKRRARKAQAELRRLSFPFNKDSKSRIICGDALTELHRLPDKSFQCVVTSPPYFGLRNYLVEGQIGLEDHPWLYIQRLVEVFREIRRVLKDDGTLFIVIRDSYAGSGRGQTGFNGIGNQTKRQGFDNSKGGKLYGFKPKDLIPIHGMLFSTLQADGWYGRQILIWNKPNCMPESVQDRFTTAHEYVLFLSKSEHPYCDSEAIKEPANNWGTRDRSFSRGGTTDSLLKHNGLRGKVYEDHPMRNMRSVLTVPTSHYPGTHFAQFSPELIEHFVLGYSRIGDMVGDPFLGSGTTAVVAKQHGRQYIGIELNPEYVQMAEQRVAKLRLMHQPAAANVNAVSVFDM